MNAISKICICTQPTEPTIDNWIKVRAFLIPAIEILGGTHTETDVLVLLLSGKMQLWMSTNAALITEVITYPRLNRLSVFVAGGNMDEIMAMKPALESFAAKNNCAQCKIEGRRGWEKIHQDYQFLSISLLKEI